ncbi:hypothetical protein Q1695_006006 [Nippostrongylus brasiliensis]|nr:hypothetical protein Q1695_006006 [Nippostrongylus brasiliensis]
MISLVTFSSSLVPLQVTPRLSLLKMQDSGNRTMLSLCSYHFTHHTLHFFLTGTVLIWLFVYILVKIRSKPSLKRPHKISKRNWAALVAG